MEQTLLLNATYEPIQVIDWQRAMTLWAQGKATVIEEHDREVRSVSFTFKLPSVMRLIHYVRMKKRPVVQFTRPNIYQRDDYSCQYCGTQKRGDELTFDHVVPVADGGTRSWENIVTACQPCNRKKGARTPAGAGMKLLGTPRRPVVLAPAVRVTVGIRTPSTWRSYLYVELERA